MLIRYLMTPKYGKGYPLHGLVAGEEVGNTLQTTDTFFRVLNIVIETTLKYTFDFE